MAEYLSREAANNAFCQHECGIDRRQCESKDCTGIDAYFLYPAPLDVLNIVFCNECKYWDALDIAGTMTPYARRCKASLFEKRYTEPIWFCADGVKKDE